MSIVKRRSFGIVPVSQTGSELPLFLILRCYQNWDFPKGGADPGEAPLDAAKREMMEETSIQQCAFEWGDVSMDSEIYGDAKVATYFLARVEKQEITLPVNPELGHPEHDEYRWVSCDDARSLLPRRLTPILDWALTHIS